MRGATCRNLWSAHPALLRRGTVTYWCNGYPVCGLLESRCLTQEYLWPSAGLAAKAGKASSAAEAKPLAEAVSSTSQPSERPASDYPSWLNNLTEPGKTLGELRRTPAEERTKHDVGLDWLCLNSVRLLRSQCCLSCLCDIAGLETLEAKLKSCHQKRQLQQSQGHMMFSQPDT